jgi:ribonucleoside-triphosphate reductase (thioredoxin)
MPSMRSLWTAGKALERENIAGYNCFSGDTKFLTVDGIKTLKESLGLVKVLNKNQQWVDGEVKCFGKQKTVKLKLGYNSVTVEIEVTLNHDWHLKDGSIVKTKDLKQGDVIPYNNVKRKERYTSIDYKLGVLHGIIYGDGTASWRKFKKTSGQLSYPKKITKQLSYSQKRVMGYMIRLCSDQEDFLPFFEDYERSYPKTYGGDPVIYMYDSFAKTHNLKELPSHNETEDYIVGFFRGWFAADGYVAENGGVNLTLDSEGLEWVQRCLPKYGYYFQGLYQFPDESNLGKRTKNTYTIRLDKASVTLDDILIKRKRERFRSFEKQFSFRGIIDHSEQEQEVYCVVEPTTRTFTLDGGILTGNCATMSIDSVKSFAELLLILMCGTGCGFSVERQYIAKLPDIPAEISEIEDVIVFADSRLGWAEGFYKYLRCLYKGEIPQHDLSRLRPKGARLKTFGGRASGPEPLEDLLIYAREMFKRAAGRRLNSIECHDLCCKVAYIVVVGGTRRSACISLSNLSDQRMAKAKIGQFWEQHGQRVMANNSVAYTEKPDSVLFMEEWLNLMKSKSGERGIFNREGAKNFIKQIGRRDSNHEFSLNPCGEILLRPNQFCNLSEVVIRSKDTKKDICEKIRKATIIGCLQSTLTKFGFLSRIWKKNTEEERLLGVSLTGLRDHPILSKVSKEAKTWLSEMKQTAIYTAKEWAHILEINVPTAITTVKPSGTVSLLVDSSSGLHARFSPYYIRRIRIASTDPLCKMLIDQGQTHKPEVGENEQSPNTHVFEFPRRSPEMSTMNDEITALDQLEYWLMLKKHWCEHSASCTIHVKESEWLSVGSWVYENWNYISGLSFLPASDMVYKLAPYEEIDEDQYNEMVAATPPIDFTQLTQYELEDQTEGSKEYACVGNSCEI